MSTNVKKVKKPMSQQTKRNLGNIFGSIISNQRAIDGAKELPIWVALIFFALSVFLPVIPSMVQVSNTYGASFVGNYTYDLDRTLSEATYQMKKDGKEFIVKDQQLEYNKASAEFVTDSVYDYVNDKTHEYDLRVYYSVGNLNELQIKCSTDYYKLGTTEKYENPSKEDKNKYVPSFVILHKDGIFVYIFQKSSDKGVAASYNGCNWKNYNSTDELLTRVIGTATEEMHNANISQYNKEVFGNWKIVFNESYIDAKGLTFRNTTLIYLGIFAALVLFMGLMIFLLTRGKKNVYHFLSILTCLKIAAWAAFTPAIIGLILGFIFPSQATLFFIMVLGIRIMWLCMKQLRPQY